VSRKKVGEDCSLDSGYIPQNMVSPDHSEELLLTLPFSGGRDKGGPFEIPEMTQPK